MILFKVRVGGLSLTHPTMHPGTLKALEFDRVVAALRSLALTPLGEAELALTAPSSDPEVVIDRQALTTEAVRLLTDAPGFPLRAPRDLHETIALLGVQGRALEPVRLFGLASFLESIEQCGHLLRRQTRQTFPKLSKIVSGITSFDREIGDIRRAIDPTGEIFDHASPALRSIRDRLRKQRQRLRGTLESYLRSRDTSKYLQEQVITDRNGRYVLMVRAEHRGSIPGIVHGSSASGASLFLEPLSTVEINNDIVALQEEEQEEVLRILLALTDAFRGRGDELASSFEIATRLDVAQAHSRLSRLMDGTEPTIALDGRLELRNARHPLLIPAVIARIDDEEADTRVTRERGPVPIDVVLTPPTTVLVITGPNTGGKTVAIKTTGLLALMAQAGLHIPALEGSSLPIFNSIFADIGDEQSIAANLSTFSWHVTNIASIDRQLQTPALVLLDEVGSGTDPVEGGALGMAIIDHFRQRGAMLIATTHHDTLKTYASTTPGVGCAAFGFMPQTFEPTYKLLYGTPGTSLALEMAEKYGLAPAIIAAARSYRTVREEQLAEHLARVEQERNRLDHERRLLTREREQVADEQARFRNREESLRQREEQLKKRLDAQLEERLRDARKEIDAVVDDVKRRAATLVSQAARRAVTTAVPLSTGETGGLRAGGRGTLDQLGDRLRADVVEGRSSPAATVQPSTSAPAHVGDKVAVGALGLEGVVESVQGREAQVNVRGKRLRASLDDLRVIGRGGSAPAPRRVSVSVSSRDAMALDLNVIGCSVDEALARADKFLDDAVMSEQRVVRVIHGHGTGQLRRAIGAFLHDHPMVERHQPAPPDQGGSGVTVVELKE